MQLSQPLPPRGILLDFMNFAERHQQRLRLGDLRHFRRRRKAFERRREDGVGVDGAGGRLVQLGERQAPRAGRSSASLVLLRFR